MNVLNPSTAAPATHASSDHKFDAASLIPKGLIFTVIGQVDDWKLGFAGRIRCTLRLSFGELQLSANRDTLPIDTIGGGDWVRAKLMHRHDEGVAMHVIGAVATVPTPDETSWIPVALYHRHAAMRELRRLLSTLEPAWQALFMAVMLDLQVQRRFFWRPAAADHDCYPGGLFDRSVAAATLASQVGYTDERDRGLATLAGLLFDIGKATDMRLLDDRTRCWPELQPHVTTAARLKSPLTRLAKSEPLLAADLSDLLAGDGSPRTVQLTPRLASLRKQVRDAVCESWGPAESFLSTIIKPGAAA